MYGENFFFNLKLRIKNRVYNFCPCDFIYTYRVKNMKKSKEIICREESKEKAELPCTKKINGGFEVKKSTE